MHSKALESELTIAIAQIGFSQRSFLTRKQENALDSLSCTLYTKMRGVVYRYSPPLSKDRDEVMHTKLRYKFELMELDNTIIAVPVGENASQFRGVVKLNETGAAILEMLEQEVSEEDILSALKTRYVVSEETLQSDVSRCINMFQEKGMLS